MGDVEFGVEVPATVRAHPLSVGHTMTDPQTARELASEPLERLRQQLHPETFDRAERAGFSLCDGVVKELLSGRTPLSWEPEA